MKKIIIPVACAATFFFSGHRANAQQFRAGASAGLVVSGIDGANTRGNDFHKVGITAGGLVTTELNSKLAMQFEINFIQKGSINPPDSLNNGYYKIALSYIEIPVLIKRHIMINVHKVPVNKIDLEFGASIGQMINHTVVNGQNMVLSNTSAYYNRTDISILAGADYNINRSVIFCFRYSNSVIPAIKKNTPLPGFLTYTFNKGNNMVFQLAFKFLFGKKAGSDSNATPAPATTEP